MAKNKLFLVRVSYNAEYVLAKGLELEEDKTLALVHLSTPQDSLTFNSHWEVIDIKSGIRVARGKARKDCLHWYELRKANFGGLAGFQKELKKIRSLSDYSIRVADTSVEKECWRKSGYQVV